MVGARDEPVPSPDLLCAGPLHAVSRLRGAAPSARRSSFRDAGGDGAVGAGNWWLAPDRLLHTGRVVSSALSSRSLTAPAGLWASTRSTSSTVSRQKASVASALRSRGHTMLVGTSTAAAGSWPEPRWE